MNKVISIKPRTPQELTEYINFLDEVVQATHLNYKTVSIFVIGTLNPLIGDVAMHNVGYVSKVATALSNVVNVLVTVTKTDENKVMVELDF